MKKLIPLMIGMALTFRLRHGVFQPRPPEGDQKGQHQGPHEAEVHDQEIVFCINKLLNAAQGVLKPGGGILFLSRSHQIRTALSRTNVKRVSEGTFTRWPLVASSTAVPPAAPAPRPMAAPFPPPRIPPNTAPPTAPPPMVPWQTVRHDRCFSLKLSAY